MQSPDMITFHCPSCSMKLQVPAQMAGVTGPCPECAANITAPLAAASPAAPSPAPSPAPPQPATPARTPAALAPNPPTGNRPTTRSSPAPSPAPQHTKPTALARTQARPQARPAKPRARWIRAIFPIAFLAVAAVLVLAVLQTIGIFNIWDYSNQRDDVITPSLTANNTPQTNTSPNGTPNGGNAGVPAPDEDDVPAPVTDREPPVPVIKDNTTTEGEFPDLHLPPPPSHPAEPTSSRTPPPTPAPPRNESPPKAGFLANQILNKFLAAKTLDERMPFMSESTRTPEELAASCLAGQLKPVKSILMVEMVPRAEDNMTQYLYYVSFQDEAEDRQRQRIVMQVSERPGIHPPRVHADAFLEHYEKKFTHYAAHPVGDVTTFHCIAEARTAGLAKNLPDESKGSVVRLEIKSHPDRPAIFNAYLNKNSPLMDQIGPRKPFPYTEARFCVLSFRWNTDDKKHPYIELNDIVCQGWER